MALCADVPLKLTHSPHQKLTRSQLETLEHPCASGKSQSQSIERVYLFAQDTARVPVFVASDP